MGSYGQFSPPWWSRLFLGHSWEVSFESPDRGGIAIKQQSRIQLHALEVTDVAINRGILWCELVIRSRSAAIKLRGLTEAKARDASDTLHAFINDHIAKILLRDSGVLGEIDSSIKDLIGKGDQYLARADISELASTFGGETSDAISHPLFSEQLLPSEASRLLPKSLAFLTDPSARERYNDEFLSSELSRYASFFDSVSGTSLTLEQREACIRLEDANLLVAAAGSGKTATMVAKVAYLLKKQLYDPGEILVLAYNTDAAEELKHRIAAELGCDKDDVRCQISTFHALGRKIIGDVTGSAPTLANWVDHPSGEARLLDRLISDLSASDPSFKKAWQELLLYFPKADMPEHAFSTEDDHRRYTEDRRDSSGRTVLTLVPDLYVRSLQEQKIVNWLWSKSVKFEYEKMITVTDQDGKKHSIKPDFFYPDPITFHEHFAIDKYGKSHIDGYVDRANLKRSFFRNSQYDFFETRSAEASDGTLLEVLEKELSGRHVSFIDKSEEEISLALKNLDFVIQRYHRLILTCIKHIRSGHISDEMLTEKVKDLYDKPRARRFVRVLIKIAKAYAQELEKANAIDFESMIGNATTFVEKGRYKSPFKLILVDEFQDISEPRADLVKALKNQKPFTKLFVVGDDWQSIYRFAGSDITIFTRFDEHFGDAWTGKLQKTFRSNDSLAKAAASFVQANPQQIKKNVSSTRAAIPQSIRVMPVDVEYKEPSMIKACHEVLTKLNVMAADSESTWKTESKPKLTVKVLARYNHGNPETVGSLQRSHLEVEFFTFHKVKGLEADYSVLLDVSEGSYGIPSRIEDDELLNLVIPLPEKYPYAEERRLFYVALTRATQGAMILHDRKRPSRFISELEAIANDSIYRQEIDGSTSTICPQCKQGYIIPKQNRKTGETFLACSTFPDCRYKPAKGERRSNT